MPGSWGAVNRIWISALLPLRAGNSALSGLVPIPGPAINRKLNCWSQLQVPLFSINQRLSSISPGSTWVPSGMVMSSMNNRLLTHTGVGEGGGGFTIPGWIVFSVEVGVLVVIGELNCSTGTKMVGVACPLQATNKHNNHAKLLKESFNPCIVSQWLFFFFSHLVFIILAERHRHQSAKRLLANCQVDLFHHFWVFA